MTINEFYRVYNKEITVKISDALREDSVNNDITSKLLIAGKLQPSKKITVKLFCRESCILAGIDILKRVFLEVDKRISFKQFYNDGNKVAANTVIMKISGSPYNILRAERTALNFIQRMSGIATLTSSFVRRLKHKRAKILHTRKTTPNFRLFEAAAVKIGGGDFHRLNLGSAFLIKDNHIKVSGSISVILKQFGERHPLTRNRKIIEIEVKFLSELKEVIAFGKSLIKIVMLDNFPWLNLQEAIKLLEKQSFKIELSGGINEKNFRQLQYKGIDFYSIGMLTHSYKSVDFSLEF